jgi:hypothetical protein
MSWIKAVKEVKDNHQYCMVHIPTGNKVTKKKTDFYIDTLEEIETMQSEGFTDKEICDKVPGAKKVSKTDCVLVDAVTAGMLCSIYDALSEQNQKKFDGFKIDFAVKAGWKLYEKCKV